MEIHIATNACNVVAYDPFHTIRYIASVDLFHSLAYDCGHTRAFFTIVGGRTKSVSPKCFLLFLENLKWQLFPTLLKESKILATPVA